MPRVPDAGSGTAQYANSRAFSATVRVLQVTKKRHPPRLRVGQTGPVRYKRTGNFARSGSDRTYQPVQQDGKVKGAIAPLPRCSPQQAEAQTGSMGGGRDVAAIWRPAISGVSKPVAGPDNSLRARTGTSGICHRAPWIWAVPVLHPLAHIPQHVAQTPRVRRLLPHGIGFVLAHRADVAPRDRIEVRCVAVAARARPRRVFPLCLRREAVLAGREQDRPGRCLRDGLPAAPGMPPLSAAEASVQD